jgi:hypothetical protein
MNSLDGKCSTHNGYCIFCFKHPLGFLNDTLLPDKEYSMRQVLIKIFNFNAMF